MKHRQVNRPSLRHGLPYRWWVSEGFWVGLTAFMILPLLALILGAWFFDWKAWW